MRHPGPYSATGTPKSKPGSQAGNARSVSAISHFVALFTTARLRYQRWAGASVNRKIFGAALTVGIMTGVVKIGGFAREVVVAAWFGTGDAMDAFLIAFLLPSFVINVVAGSFNAALIPTYIRVREHQGQEAAQQLFSSVLVLSLLLLAGVAVLLAACGPYLLPLLGSGFGPEKQALTRSLFYLFLPAIIINGLTVILGAVLNAGERFGLAAITPVLVPLTAVLLLLASGRGWGIYAVAAGTVIGFALELAVLTAALRRHGLSLIPRWYGKTPDLEQVIGQYLPMVGGAILMSSTTLVDQSMAAMLDPGSVAALNYGNKVVALILGLGATALGTAVLPYLSQMTSRNDWHGIRHTLRKYTCLILWVTAPVTLVLFLFSEPVTGFLFQRGAFTAADTKLVARVQSMYALQIPWYVLGILSVRLLNALRQNIILIAVSAVNIITNVVFNYVLMLHYGVAGIALSTGLVYMVSTALVLLAIRHFVRTHYRVLTTI